MTKTGSSVEREALVRPLVAATPADPVSQGLPELLRPAGGTGLGTLEPVGAALLAPGADEDLFTRDDRAFPRRGPLARIPGQGTAEMTASHPSSLMEATVTAEVVLRKMCPE